VPLLSFLLPPFFAPPFLSFESNKTAILDGECFSDRGKGISSASTSLLAMYLITSRRTCCRSCLRVRFLLRVRCRVRRVSLGRRRRRRRRVLRGGFRAAWDCCGRRRVWRLWWVGESTLISGDRRNVDVSHVHVHSKASVVFFGKALRHYR
jgi:hypothetical protein